MSNKPTFLCIGVQKGGTTSIINYMNQHPDIYMVDKELHFFDYIELNRTSIANYESNFIPNGKLIIGEKTPSYCYLRYAINRIHFYNPNIKLIILLREPIARAYSQYNMFHAKHLNNFLEYILPEKNIALKNIDVNYRDKYHIVRGFYDEQIMYILSKFPRKNLYIGIAEEIQKNKQLEYNKIFKFLGAKDDIVIDETKDIHVRTYTQPLNINHAKVLYGIYKPHNEKLYEILGRKVDIWENYYKTLV